MRGSRSECDSGQGIQAGSLGQRLANGRGESHRSRFGVGPIHQADPPLGVEGEKAFAHPLQNGLRMPVLPSKCGHLVVTQHEGQTIGRADEPLDSSSQGVCKSWLVCSETALASRTRERRAAFLVGRWYRTWPGGVVSSG